VTMLSCVRARPGRKLQSLLRILKSAEIVPKVVLRLALGGGHTHARPLLDRPISTSLIGAIGAAMIPIAFAYGGWQTATFVAGEMRDARRDLSRGLILGVTGVVALYLSVNYVCLRVLGAGGLDATSTPASEVMRTALGERGAQWIAIGIAVSTLGFLSQSVLTAPRVYYAMAQDGLFFRAVGRLSERTGAPVAAIILQGIAATVIACSGRYGE